MMTATCSESVIINDAIGHDVIFICRTGESLGFHKLLLAASSRYLNHILKESENSEDPAMIILPDFSVSEVESVLNFLSGR